MYHADLGRYGPKYTESAIIYWPKQYEQVTHIYLTEGVALAIYWLLNIERRMIENYENTCCDIGIGQRYSAGERIGNLVEGCLKRGGKRSWGQIEKNEKTQQINRSSQKR